MSRTYIGKKRTYRMNDQRYAAFQEWCSGRGINVSLAIQGAVELLMKKGNISQLLKNQKHRNLAENLLFEFEEKIGNEV